MGARPSKGGGPWWYARPFYLLLLKGFLLLLAALAAAVWWIFSMPDMSGIRDPNNGAQFIRERCHFFLVRPEWISVRVNATGLEPDQVWRWENAEMEARLIVVFVLWAVGLSLLIWRYSRCARQARPATAFSIKL
jgi:hypothetical protein